jgi:hypothetical protein
MHPDLLPTAADLDDPLGFREGAVALDEMSDDAFEAGLRDLLGGRPGGEGDEALDEDGGPGRAGESPEGDESDDDAGDR